MKKALDELVSEFLSELDKHPDVAAELAGVTEPMRARVTGAESEPPCAAEHALDDIAAMCGCASWQYPGQVVRDVKQALKV